MPVMYTEIQAEHNTILYFIVY